jgi:bifunctional NMN adenylyltransferase/nudix hydrolase
MTHEVAVLIGRFQPFHAGHLLQVQAALAKARRLFLLLGSHRSSPNTRNPWSSAERQQMISAALSAQQSDRVTFIPLRDHLYSDNRWIKEVQHKVAHACRPGDRVLLMGYHKDASSSYLNVFPQWDRHGEAPAFILDATPIRHAYFLGEPPDVWGKDLPAGVKTWLEAYQHTERYRWLAAEAAYISQYRKLASLAPHPPTLVSTDAVVIQSDHVLVVRRRLRPGLGLIALPGGFLRPNEDLLEGMLRELREETGLKVPKPVLEGSITNRAVFDAPGRSQRGRIISHASLIQLKPGPLPHVHGGTGVEQAFWLPLSEASSQEEAFFEDHFHIIQHLFTRPSTPPDGDSDGL